MIPTPTDFLKQAEAIRPEKFSEFADAHRQNSSRGSRSAGNHGCACDAYWAHISLQLLSRPRLSGAAAGTHYWGRLSFEVHLFSSISFAHRGWRVSGRRTSALTYLRCRFAHLHIPRSGVMSVLPRWVKEYSTAMALDLVGCTWARVARVGSSIRKSMNAISGGKACR
jgi:hypothetical protein